MKYVATVEIEFETKGDPLEVLRHIMEKSRLQGPGSYVDHYHIVEQPRELK